MTEWEDYYQILGVDPKASEAEIKRAYREKAFILHPDRLTGAPESVRHRAEEELKELNRAYDVLKDPQKRQDYDSEWLQRSGKVKPKPVVEPKHIKFHDVEPGKVETSSFTIRNIGGTYSKIRISNPDSWVRVVQYSSLTDSDELPLQVEIEAEGKEWGKTYTEHIEVKLDEQETQVRIELQTKPEPIEEKVTASNIPKVGPTTPPPVSSRRGLPAWGKGIIGFVVVGLVVILIMQFWPSGSHAPLVWPSGSTTPIVAAGNWHTMGLKSDGTVIAVGSNEGGQCDVSSLTAIIQLAGGLFHTVGLKSNGTVVAVGDNYEGQSDVNSWTDIIHVASHSVHTVGIKSDGSVVAVGRNLYGQCNIGGWTDIVKVAAGDQHTVGLKSDGTVVAVGDNYNGQCDVDSWTDIIQIAAGSYHTVGLKSDGTVVAVGLHSSGQCDVGGWTDIIQVAAGFYHTVGLKMDGTVVAVPSDLHNGQCDVNDWTGIVHIAAGEYHTIGLKDDGTVYAVGWNYFGQCNVSNWILN